MLQLPQNTSWCILRQFTKFLMRFTSIYEILDVFYANLRYFYAFYDNLVRSEIHNSYSKLCVTFTPRTVDLLPIIKSKFTLNYTLLLYQFYAKTDKARYTTTTTNLAHLLRSVENKAVTVPHLSWFYSTTFLISNQPRSTHTLVTYKWSDVSILHGLWCYVSCSYAVVNTEQTCKVIPHDLHVSRFFLHDLCTLFNLFIPV
jgi:hypothetical protein